MSSGKGADEIRILRRTMRDLVALSALPAVWAGYRPLQVAEGLAEVLLSTLRLDLVYLRLPGQTDGYEIEVTRTTGGSPPTDQSRGIGRALAPWLDGAGIDPASTIPNPSVPGRCAWSSSPFGAASKPGSWPPVRGRRPFPAKKTASSSPWAPTDGRGAPRLHAEEELRLAHARLELAVRGSNINLLELNMPDGVLENSRLELISVGNQLAGYDRAELPTDFATTMALVHPDDRERVVRVLRAHLSGQTPECEAEYRVRRKDGSYRWRLACGVAVRDAEGRAIRCMISTIDINELKRAEEALRASEQRFRTFVDHATDAFFLQADEGVILDVNRQACQSLGYTRDELIGMTPLEFDPDLTPAMMEEMRRRGDAGEEVALESRHRRKDGTVFPVEIRGRWFWEGGHRFIVSLARDITERKRLEAELRQARDRLDLAIRASNVGIWEVDMPDGVYANGTGTWINVWEQLGLEPPEEDSPFVSWLDYLHPEDKDRLLRALSRLPRVARRRSTRSSIASATGTGPTAGCSPGGRPSAIRPVSRSDWWAAASTSPS